MRLYQEYPYQSQFSTTVRQAWSEGQQHWVVLEQTLFYPAAGGQPCDLGRLGEAEVLDVSEESKASGRILHRLSAPLVEGQSVVGELDWSRRYRHMQRHTAQHLLSQAFLRAGGWETVAVSLQSEICTIDFAQEPVQAVLEKAEAQVAWAVYANLPIRSFWVEQDELARYPLRRPPKVQGAVRLVEIEDWDLSACGGTHLRSSAEAGPVKLLRLERHKGGSRVYFMAGWEALEDYHRKHQLLAHLAAQHSTTPLEVERPLQKQADELFRVRGENQDLRAFVAERLAQELLGSHQQDVLVARVPAVVLTEVGARLAEWPNILALLVAEEGPTARLLLTRHASRPENLHQLWKAYLEPLGARGGGRETLVGVISSSQVPQVFEVARRFVEEGPTNAG